MINQTNHVQLLKGVFIQKSRTQPKIQQIIEQIESEVVSRVGRDSQERFEGWCLLFGNWTDMQANIERKKNRET